MPELPEVETIRLGVEAQLRGHVLDEVRLLGARVSRRDPDVSRYAALGGRRVTEVARRGKFLWFVLDGSDDALLVHLGMSGQLLYFSEPPVELPRHAAATLIFDDATLHFVDQRTFGYLRVSPLVPTADGRPAGTGTTLPKIPAAAVHIARDPLDPALDVDAAASRMARTTSAIKRVLLDQGYVSGIGNIYADETLWHANVHPEAPATTLGEARLAAIVRTSAEVMRSAVAAGGTSFDALYVNTLGTSGYFERELAVYGRAGQSCRRCGKIVQKSVVGGRGTYTCPHCQRPETGTSSEMD